MKAPVGVLEVLNPGDSVGGIKAEAKAILSGGAPAISCATRIVDRCNRLEGSMDEARAVVAELIDAAGELLAQFDGSERQAVVNLRAALARVQGGAK